MTKSIHIQQGETITVKDLKAFLADIPDDTRIVIEDLGADAITKSIKIEFFESLEWVCMEVEAESCVI